jgi:hypothetical protein
VSDVKPRTTATKPVPSPLDFAETTFPLKFLDMADKVTTPAKEVPEDMRAATIATDGLIKDICSKAAQGVQHYNTKVVEFAWTNVITEFYFVRQLSRMRSPSEFVMLSTKHARKQFELFAHQTKELTALWTWRL